MTTNHRPQLESKRGRDIAIKNTIQHARSQPGQTSLKMRSDIAGSQIGREVGKRALDELSSGEKRLKLPDSTGIEKKIVAASDSEIDKQGEAKSKDTISKEPVSSSSDSGSDSESDEEAETEALLAELAKTKELNRSLRDSAPAKENPEKRGWRTKTSFSRTKATTEKFTTDTTKSGAHQKFLSDYIR